VGRPVDSADDEHTISDDGTGAPLAGKRRNPQHVFIFGAAPNDWQILIHHIAKAGRAAETR
jgi:hypothetical protein